MLVNKFEEYLDSLNLNFEKTNNLSFLRYKIGNITYIIMMVLEQLKYIKIIF